MNQKNILKNIVAKQGTATEFDPITDAEIDEMFGTAAGTGTNAQDYVVEHGTSGIWTYRKWASGIAECWGSVTKTLNYNNQIASYLYQSDNGWTQTLPSDLFTAVNNASVNGYDNGTHQWFVGCGCYATTSSLQVNVIGWNTGGNRTQVFQMHVIGKWK